MLLLLAGGKNFSARGVHVVAAAVVVVVGEVLGRLVGARTRAGRGRGGQGRLNERGCLLLVYLLVVEASDGRGDRSLLLQSQL